MQARWLYRKSDGVFLQGGFYDVQPPFVEDAPDFINYGVAEFGDADQPDPRVHRFDAVEGKRLATAQELVEQSDADQVSRAHATSRQKDILATVALLLKRTDPTWSTMTAAQKRTAVFDAADEWRALRVVVDRFV